MILLYWYDTFSLEISLFPIFQKTAPVFSATQILLFYISWDLDNVTMSNNKNTSKRLSVSLKYRYYQCYEILIGPFCMIGLLVHVCLCEKVRVHLGQNSNIWLNSFDIMWHVSAAIYTKNSSFVLCHSVSRFTEWNKWEGLECGIGGGTSSQRMLFCGWRTFCITP